MSVISTAGARIDRWDTGALRTGSRRVSSKRSSSRDHRDTCSSEGFITFISKPHDDDPALISAPYRRFKRLPKQAKAKAVLSSSWRVDPIGLLAAKHFRVPFIDGCPDMPSERRCVECVLGSSSIRRWCATPSVSVCPQQA